MCCCCVAFVLQLFGGCVEVVLWLCCVSVALGCGCVLLWLSFVVLCWVELWLRFVVVVLF